MEADLANSFGDFSTLKKIDKIPLSHEHPKYQEEDEQKFWETLRENIGTLKNTVAC